MAARTFRTDHVLLWPILLGLAYFCFASLSLHLTRGVDGVATIWPASGILLAALLLARPRRWAAFMIAAGVASLAANIDAGVPWSRALAFSVVNVGEALLATFLVRRRRPIDLSFADPASVGRFCLAAMIASTVSATLANSVSADPSGAVFLSWLTTVALGMMIVTPVVLTGANIVLQCPALPPARVVIEGTVILSGVAILSIGVFGQSTYPLLTLPMLGVLAATYRLGPHGATVSVLLIAIIGSVATGYGLGPVTFVDGAERAVLFFQFYLLTLLGSALPLAALLAARARMTARIGRDKRLLEMAERAAHVGHWRFAIDDGSMLWSAEVFRMHGRDERGGAPSPQEAMRLFHPDDQSRIVAAMEQLLDTGEPFDLDARICRRDGTIRDVHVRGEAERDRHDQTVAVFGMMQDVTARVESVRALHVARDAAEREARRAVMLSETDQLTGIANRRKALAVLEDRIACANAGGQPFAIAMLDIDHFKSINDDYGHAMGDVILVRVADLCRGALRETDLVGRIGGEEFMLVIDGATPEGALVTAERVRDAIASAHPVAPGVRTITASLGVATFHPGTDCRSLMQAADDALYAAKHGGRNTLRVAA
jgi:diguanylate cyclase (GGDEF)-like protein